MYVSNPEVTLKEDGHGFPEEARDTAQLDWTVTVSARGDDGNHYWFHVGAMSLREAWGDRDIWAMSVRSTPGEVVQPAGSVHRVAAFPTGISSDWHIEPRGALKATTLDDRVTVEMGGFNLVCRADKTWSYDVTDSAAEIGGTWVHRGNGFPTWYGKDVPQRYTPHSIAYGYVWAGAVDGVLRVRDREVGIHGAGVRGRYYAIDTCPDEVGGWHDWVWFHFDEASGSLDEMKVSRNKDGSVYLTLDELYLPTTDFEIRHYDWAYLASSAAFIPTRYEISVRTVAGVLELKSTVVGADSATGIREVPDSPSIILDWGRVEGTFTYNDGRTKSLTNGLGGAWTRQWRPYPTSLLTHVEADGEESLRI